MKIQLSSHQTSVIHNLKMFEYRLWCIIQYLCINIQLCYLSILRLEQSSRVRVKAWLHHKGHMQLFSNWMQHFDPLTITTFNSVILFIFEEKKCSPHPTHVCHFVFDLECHGLQIVAARKTSAPKWLMELCLVHSHLLGLCCNFSSTNYTLVRVRLVSAKFEMLNFSLK